jgi:hypothetical protein
MGALVTLELAADAPQLDLPWIITFGPLNDDEDWEPVVCGPYERPHALALAQHVVADEELMAVVEPVLPATSLAQIREEIANAQRLAIEEEEADTLDSDLPDFDETDDGLESDDEDLHGAPEPPTAEELRAGFGRISSRLTGS